MVIFLHVEEGNPFSSASVLSQSQERSETCAVQASQNMILKKAQVRPSVQARPQRLALDEASGLNQDLPDFRIWAEEP